MVRRPTSNDVNDPSITLRNVVVDGLPLTRKRFLARLKPWRRVQMLQSSVLITLRNPRASPHTLVRLQQAYGGVDLL
ncbi:hypothetical protein MPRF_56750 [Mycolicibacterium parafortuitum]|uniref:Uncharacterized protein n=1 Tax=Mycolicibacterium parafortuitum TaxID=39692 RepID=A0A7I7UF37_MYCPF|nr:hypothetical protein MPRF_56750 [Mycolicibacterium parafortuitum]